MYKNLSVPDLYSIAGTYYRYKLCLQKASTLITVADDVSPLSLLTLLPPASYLPNPSFTTGSHMQRCCREMKRTNGIFVGLGNKSDSCNFSSRQVLNRFDVFFYLNIKKKGLQQLALLSAYNNKNI